MTKPSSSAAMAGTFTRSRAEIYVHRTRSGHRRPDSSHLNRRRPAPVHPPPPHAAIKDLRAHRVFSPRAAVQECDIRVSSPGSEVDKDSFQSTPPDLDIVQRTAEMIESEPKDALLKTLQPRPVIAPCSRSKLYRNLSSFSYRRLLPYLLDLEKDHSRGEEIHCPRFDSAKVEKSTEENSITLIADPSPVGLAESTKGSPTNLICESVELNQKPAPDSSTSSPIEVAVDDMMVTESPNLIRDTVYHTKSPNLSRDTAFHASSKNYHESSRIVSRSRSKLYHNTSSFGYRRLMPYLLDLEKAISGGTEILHPQVESMKVERNTEEKPLLLSTDPSAAQKDHTIGSEVTESTQGSPNKLCGEIIEPSEKNVPARPLEVAVDDMIVTESLSLSSDEASQAPPRNSQESSGIASGLRSKLYRDPSSFGYRRLLPYLLDLEKDVSGTEIHPQADSTKSEKNAEQKPLLGSTDPSDAHNDHTIGSESKPDATSGKNLECDDNHVPKCSELSPAHDGDIIIIESTEALPSPPEVALDDMIVKTSSNLSSENACQAPSQNSQESSGIALCSRSKLYRNPRSFGYRRLLPYLRDLEKDISGGTEILHPHLDSTKTQKDTEEKSLLLIAEGASASTSGKNLDLDGNHVPESSISSPSFDVDMIAIESTKVPPTKLHCDNIEPNKKHVPKNSVPSPLEVTPDDTIVTESHNQSGENACNAPNVVSGVPLESSDLEFLQSRDSSFYSPTNCGTLSVKELSILDRRSFSIVEEGCSVSPLVFKAGRGPLPLASQLGKSGHLGNHALAPKKGILKRNTRGCRGLCTCLDCASFRLHAERAYEFSRRQILEADEVVTGLTKELSCLRHIIEKSDASQKQIKEVCERASRVEELAKIRMQQMINEMNTHCRLPGPRVRFAERIEERSTRWFTTNNVQH